ncbi:partner of xrn-2 protein 1 [Dermatophagoides farinae]|uniref:XRN2-binding (XTBD) domain-containing protein n=1 Tax=Dermatophagoides farinae TaxID=6954 RepID=A0A922L9L3_DERFA|nr:partner of xrn-2 protein 1-like [Dermatophagoides farinae]KAH7641684.1 hypothetical protein HUG17_4729 [Dermatophagoides farinae]KAH9527634.1 hypothetical protein DERF_001642 [Dermatophagoides farinae]
MSSNDQQYIKDEREIDQYRKHWEIEDHWQMRKSFMLAHYDHIVKDRLLCYAQLYVNIKVLQNEYDQALMNEIKALASKIPLANLKSRH